MAEYDDHGSSFGIRDANTSTLGPGYPYVGDPPPYPNIFPTTTTNPEPPKGCWVAYYHDRSAVHVFGDELTALRFAVENTMNVDFVEWGAEIIQGTQPGKDE